MLTRLLSNDLPRSRWLTALLVVLFPSPLDLPRKAMAVF